MKSTNRRKFITTTAVMAAATAASAMPAVAPAEEYPIVHHVFFWLKNPDSKEDLEKLIAGVKTLAKIEHVHQLRVGVEAATEKRDVTDKSWQVSELIFFKSLADQAAYQNHPVHLEFVKNCSMLWEKVTVFDMQVV